MTLLKRGLRYLKRELLGTLPHGLMNWRYLLPSQDIRVQQHRHLWWTSPSHFPRPIWLLLEAWLWLRWVSFDAWRATWKTVRVLGPDVLNHEGLTLAQQAYRTLRISIAWCIPPSQIYSFKLYLNSAAVLDFIFDHETTAYHAWRSQNLGFTRQSLKLLQDKEALSQKLSAAGVPLVQTLSCIPANTDTNIQHWLKDGNELFCKTRSGSRGLGAFTVSATAEGLHGQQYKGRALNTTQEVENAWQNLLALDDALIQPLLKNHPHFDKLSAGSDVITLRFITQKQKCGLNCLSATLEVNVTDPQDKSSYYVLLPIESMSGEILPYPSQALFSAAERQVSVKLLSTLEPNATIPNWATVTQYSYQAHQFFPDIREIAWDWVITPEGPRLLEGNAGWGTEALQILQGGLLKSE